MKAEKRVPKAMRSVLTRSLIATAVFAAFSGVGYAQETIKIGLLATLEGPFAVPGQDGMRGAELAQGLATWPSPIPVASIASLAQRASSGAAGPSQPSVHPVVTQPGQAPIAHVHYRWKGHHHTAAQR